MTKKNYIAIADTIKIVRTRQFKNVDVALDYLINALTTELSQDNDQFDAKKFREQAGIGKRLKN